MCGFLQGNSYSTVGFCLSEVPLCKLFQETKGYQMGQPGKREVKRTHTLFIDDLKVYQEIHKILKDVNETIVQASHDTGACYGVAKCAEIIFEKGKMVKGEGLQVLQERMKTIDPDQKETYKFLGVEQADGIKTKEVFNKFKDEIKRRLQMLTKTELNDKHLIKAINTKLIPVAAYPMNVCKLTKAELNELDLVVKRELRKCNMLGRQSSDKRLYRKRDVSGRGLKSRRDVFVETRLRVACYMVKSSNKWIKAAWKRKLLRETNSIKDKAIKSMYAVGTLLDFEDDCILLDGEMIEKDWKLTWRAIKARLKKSVEQKRREEYLDKQMQSEIFRKQDESCNLWLIQNLTPRKTASVMTMLEEMVETK